MRTSKFLFTFLAVFSLHTAHVLTREASTEQAQQERLRNFLQQQLQQQENKKILDQLRAQYQALATAVDNALTIIKEDIRDVGLGKDKHDTMRQLGKISRLIKDISKKDLTGFNETKAALHSQLIPHIEKQLAKLLQKGRLQKASNEKFAREIQDKIKELRAEEISLEDALKNLRENQQRLANLNAATRDLGLNWVQKNWRSFRKTKTYRYGPEVLKWTARGLLAFGAIALIAGPQANFFGRPLKDQLERIPAIGSRLGSWIDRDVTNPDLAHSTFSELITDLQRARGMLFGRFGSVLNQRDQIKYMFTKILSEEQINTLHPIHSTTSTALSTPGSFGMPAAYPTFEELKKTILSLQEKRQKMLAAPGYFRVLLEKSGFTTALGALALNPFKMFAKAAVEKAGNVLDLEDGVEIVQEFYDETTGKAVQWINGEKQRTGSEKFVDTSFGLNDIIGQTALKKEIVRILQTIEDEERLSHIESTLNEGLLLYGPPGTGKTMGMKVLASEIKKRFPEKKVFCLPVTSKMLAKVSFDFIFKWAKNKPGIVILQLDEADKIFDSKERIHSFQTHMGNENRGSSEKRIVIGTTNFPEKIPPAIKRHGRLGTLVPCPLPSFDDRATFFLRESDENSLDIPEEFFISLAEEAEGASIIDLKTIMKKAREAATAQGKSLNAAHVMNEFNSLYRKILPPRQLSDKEAVVIAGYQVAKAMGVTLFPTDREVTCVTTLPVKAQVKNKFGILNFHATNKKSAENDLLVEDEDDSLIVDGGMFTTHGIMQVQYASNEDRLNNLRTLIAGQVGLKLLLGQKYSDYMPEDTAHSLDLIKRSIAQREKITDEIVLEALERQREIEAEVTIALTPYKAILKKLALDLVKKRIIYQARWNRTIKESGLESINNMSVMATSEIQQANDAELMEILKITPESSTKSKLELQAEIAEKIMISPRLLSTISTHFQKKIDRLQVELSEYDDEEGDASTAHMPKSTLEQVKEKGQPEEE